MARIKKPPFILIILDGWGLSAEKRGNAIKQAVTPVIDILGKNYPHGSLQASGISAGLYWGDAGNSEVGHLNIGAGRIVYQIFPRISLAIENGSFFKNSKIIQAVEHSKKNGKPLHIMGLLSDAGVHSHISHIFALIKIAKENKIPLKIHLFADGRDMEPKSALDLIYKIEDEISGMPGAKIATIMGRSIAMDRNDNWELTQKAYECLAQGKCAKAETAEKAIKNSYLKNITDEFIEPAAINPEENDFISPGCGVIFFNFREDRARQLSKAFIEKEFSKFSREKIDNLYFLGMAEYEENLLEHVAFPPQKITNPLAQVLSENGLRQLHIAETEKYAHATYFFNGGLEKPYLNEDWHLIPSRPDGDYKNHPQMSAAKIASFVENALEQDKYDFILVNFANADMVGHTGDLQAAIKAVEEVDKCAGQIIKAGQSKGASFLITADHGNAENMIDFRTGQPLTEHTENPVPIYIIAPDNAALQHNPDFSYGRSLGILADIAPTILEMLEIEKSEEMAGESLLERI